MPICIQFTSLTFIATVRYCNGLRSIIIWDHLLSIWGILKTILYRSIGRTGRGASCQVTIPGLTSNYQVVVSKDLKCKHVLVDDLCCIVN